jgi:hypothetical protein
VITEVTSLKIVLILLVTPGIAAPAQQPRNPPSIAMNAKVGSESVHCGRCARVGSILGAFTNLTARDVQC